MSSPCVIAWFGQAGSQTSQLMHSELMSNAIGFKPKRPGEARPHVPVMRKLWDFFEHETATGGFNGGFHTLGISRLADEQHM